MSSNPPAENDAVLLAPATHNHVTASQTSQGSVNSPVPPSESTAKGYLEVSNATNFQPAPTYQPMGYPPVVPNSQLSGMPSPMDQRPLSYTGYVYSPIPPHYQVPPPPLNNPVPEKPFWKRYLIYIIIIAVIILAVIIGVVIYLTTLNANRSRSLGSTCSSSSQCSRYCGSGLCGGNGAICYSSSDCINYCVNGYCSSSSSVSGSSSRSNGASCTSSSQCTHYCGSGLCGGNGASCTYSSDCINYCVNGYCSSSSSSGSGSSLQSNGASCTLSSQCTHYCGGGLCGGNGAICSSSSDCINYCVNGYCSSSSSSSSSGSNSRSNGSSCTATSQCVNFCSPTGICGGTGAICLSTSDCVRSCVLGSCT
ncbi:hypothetical protein HK098_003660 [Nowakowskiella sp. JEL0407]|nr:hypothetical protein HK098_003660 [Nowakowskiella sp. JEL0407]